MSEKTWEFYHKRFTRENSKREAREGIRIIAGLDVDGNRKSAITFAARALGIPIARVTEIYYGRAHRIDAHEADRIRAYLEQVNHLIAERARLNAEIREFRAEAPASLGALHPPSLPDLEVQAAQVTRRARR